LVIEPKHVTKCRHRTILIEESPYKPDTVKGAVFKREFNFARCFCPFLFAIICLN
jgi:hypothetical protein